MHSKFNEDIMKNNETPKIAILGYGSMGKEIEKIAKARDIVITNIFDIDNMINPNEKYDFDIAIDFTYPDAVLQNIKTLTAMKKSIVVGTTGWEKDLTEIKELVKKNNVGLIYASNFSIGMQMFMRIIDFASKQINKLDNYDVFINEIHHHRKKDAPSGTALTLANKIINNVERKNKLLSGNGKGEIKDNELHVSSTRGGEITGIHSVFIDSIADTIELTHRAKNRSGFAEGAVRAALWLGNKKGIFNFTDIFNEILEV